MKRNTYLALFIFTLMAIFTSACYTDGTTTSNAKEELMEATDAMSELYATERDSLIREMENMRSQINEEIAELREQINATSSSADSTINRQLKMLSEKGKNLNAFLEDVVNVSEETWEEWKRKAENTVSDIEEDLNDAAEDTM